jgi:PD-(D/E)XK nuclease superfamily protein
MFDTRSRSDGSALVDAADDVLPTPTQQRVRSDLFATGQPRPSFDPDLGQELRAELERGLAAVGSERPSDEPLMINKGMLARVHTCEGLWAAERAAGFAWSPVTVRGVIAHKAVELAVNARHLPPPMDLVDMAIERLIDAGGDWSPRAWLLDAPAAEMAEVRGAAADWLIKFQDSFPPLKREWRPRLESALTVDLCGGAVLLRGKVDLALGAAGGSVARVLIVDFKTGRINRTHLDDLRFYAMLETIRVGVPPFRIATFSLDSGTWHAEDVDVDVLAAAVRRTVDGVAKVHRLTAPTPPAPRLAAGPACAWCPAAPACPAAIDRSEDDGELD